LGKFEREEKGREEVLEKFESVKEGRR